jgi:hypothetical protein
MRELKITNINGTIYLYPVPVIKEKKYLIRCASMETAKEIIHEILENILSHPDDSEENFQFVSIHTDQRTKIFEKRSLL